MSEDPFKELIEEDRFVNLRHAPKVKLIHIEKCIYCGSEENLSDEHIVPFALNGAMILPKSSCSECAKITSKFELSVTHTQLGTKAMYGLLRNKRNYKSRKNNKPKSIPISYETYDGSIKYTELKIENYPFHYSVVILPAPGILSGAALSDKNPDIKVNFRCDSKEIDRAVESIGVENIKQLNFREFFPYGDFYRLLAKIAHGFLIATYGLEGFIPLLPDLILGRSPYLSHYVGGFVGNTILMDSHYVSQNILFINGELYISVSIHLLGGVPMQTYQVIAAKVIDFNRMVNFAGQHYGWQRL